MTFHDLVEENAAMRAELALLRLLANNVPAAIAYYQREGFTCRFANRGYAQLFGQDEQSIIGLTFAQVIGEAAAHQIQPMVDLMLDEQQSSSYERVLPDGQGGQRTIEVSLVPHVGPDGGTVGAFVLVNDISRHRRAELALRESEDRLAKFMHASAEGIAFHRDGLITDVNPPLLQLTGRRLEDILGRPALDFVAPDQRARVGDVMRSGDEITYETAVLHADGTRLPVEFIVRTLVYGGERHRMTIVRDLRDRLEARRRIDYLAHHDALTGLPNRASFIERVEGLLTPALAGEVTLALLFIDLDHFKRVNDSLGHLAGDVLLQTVARRITGCLRGNDLVSRFGGDEFLVLLTAPRAGTPSGGGDETGAAVHEVARKLLAAVGAPMQLAGATISVTPSIGVALCPQHGGTAEELIKHADTAMYQAKARGRAGVSLFEPAMADSAYAELAMESRLAQAVRDQEFVLHFQPQLRLADGALAGCEALIRWAHPQRGLVGPEDFLAVAESSRLMLPIGRWVLRQALQVARRLRAAGLCDGPLGVNLSPLQFHAGDFVESLQQLLHDEGAQGAWLELEVTERILMDDIEVARSMLQRLKAAGVRIAVDDFGTGYTSLGHLKDLPIDRLKIDRSFVRDLPGDRGSAAIAGAIVQMARSLGLRTVAEGVENDAQLQWARSAGCDDLQGHALARPMPVDELERWLAARASRGAPLSPCPP